MSVRYRYAELRADGDLSLSGVALAYGDVAELPWGRERIDAGAFGDVSGLDVRLDVQHQREEPLARTGGGGLELDDDNRSLRVRAELVDTQRARDTMALVRAGVLRGLSVEFMPTQSRFESDLEVIEKAELRAVGVVDRGAYPQSVIDAAKRSREFVLARRRQLSYSLPRGYVF